MKFTLDRASLESFNKNKCVELEGFYTDDQIREINEAIEGIINEEKFEKREEIMRFCHNLFLKIKDYKKLLQLSLLGEVAYELISVKPLRLAYDQLLVASTTTFDQKRETLFLEGTHTLEKRSSENELVLGVIIALKASEEQLPFPGKAGRVTFFSPQVPLPFEFLKTRLADRYLLLAFSTQHAQYLFNEADPQNHYLKNLGYVYGDRLKDSISPIIYR